MDKDTEQKPTWAMGYARVSSLAQTKDGKTGIQRQVDDAELIAKREGWEYRKDLSMIDPGKSGYKGEHLKGDGALGLLLQKLREGKVPKNGVVIFEAQDRLSRLRVIPTMNIMDELVQGGLCIWIEKNKKLLTRESMDDLPSLMYILFDGHAGRSYVTDLIGKVKKASVVKHKRVDEGEWSSYKIRCPRWLSWNAKTNSYDRDEGKIEILNKVFNLYANGMGLRSIAKKMTRENVAYISTNPKNGWNVHGLRHWFQSRLVIGYSVGNQDKIERKIYPQVISDELYYKCKDIMNGRKTGKFSGNTLSGGNLFAGIVKCKCGGSCVLYGTDRKRDNGYVDNYKGLRCNRFVTGNCDYGSTSLRSIQASFIVWSQLEHSASAAMFRSGYSSLNTTSKKDESVATYELIQHKLNDIKQRIETYSNDYAEEPSKALLKIMNKAEQEQTELEKQLEQAKCQVAISLTDQQEKILKLSDTFKNDWIAKSKDPEWRLSLREHIRSVISEMTLDSKEKTLTLTFKDSTKQPVFIKMFKNGCLIDGVNYEFEPWMTNSDKDGYDMDNSKHRAPCQKLKPNEPTTTKPCKTCGKPTISWLGECVKCQRVPRLLCSKCGKTKCNRGQTECSYCRWGIAESNRWKNKQAKKKVEDLVAV